MEVPQRRLHPGVAQDLHDVRQADAAALGLRDHDRGRGVPQAVELEVRNPGEFADPGQDPPGIEPLPLAADREDEVTGPPLGQGVEDGPDPGRDRDDLLPALLRLRAL